MWLDTIFAGTNSDLPAYVTRKSRGYVEIYIPDLDVCKDGVSCRKLVRGMSNAIQWIKDNNLSLRIGVPT